MAGTGLSELSAVDRRASRRGQMPLFEYEGERVEPRWVQVNVNGVRVEHCREFGGPWLAMQLITRLRLDEYLDEHQLAILGPSIFCT